MIYIIKWKRISHRLFRSFRSRFFTERFITFLIPLLNIECDLQTASTRALMYNCTTDNCNNQTNLQRALNGKLSNSSHVEYPLSESPLSSCLNCLLLQWNVLYCFARRLTVSTSDYQSQLEMCGTKFFWPQSQSR